MKALLFVLVGLGVLLVVGDRVAVTVTERVLSQEIRASGELGRAPSVEIVGFPFLTQAVAGRYDDVRVRSRGSVGELDLERLDVRLRGAQVSLSDAVRGDVTTIPVDAVSARVLVSYDVLSQEAGDAVVVSAQGDLLRVEGSVTVLGRELTAAALSEVAVDGEDVVVTARDFDTGSGAVDRGLRALLADTFDFRLPVTDLPYGLALTGATVGPDGVALSAAGGPAVLAP